MTKAINMRASIEHNHPEKTQRLRYQLKQMTAADHHVLDHHPLLAQLIKPSLEPAQYARILQTMYWINVPLHERLTRALARFEPQSDYRVSNRLSWLRQDLAFFGLSASDPCGFAPQGDRPPITSAEQLIGEIYVIEGSTLGGQVIARLLQGRLAVTAESGGRFFHGHGDSTQQRWHEFWNLAQRLTREDQMSACTQAAHDLFCYLIDTLSIAQTYWQTQCPSNNPQLQEAA